MSQRCLWLRCAYHSGVNDTTVQPTLSIYSANTRPYSKSLGALWCIKLIIVMYQKRYITLGLLSKRIVRLIIKTYRKRYITLNLLSNRNWNIKSRLNFHTIITRAETKNFVFAFSRKFRKLTKIAEIFAKVFVKMQNLLFSLHILIFWEHFCQLFYFKMPTLVLSRKFSYLCENFCENFLKMQFSFWP
jgi:hypothetical protein